MNKNPSISIGLPVFNGERFLKKTIDSILSQTFFDFELIISDNASTDNTKNICQDYVIKDNRVRYFRRSQNNGFCDNYKFVLQRSNGIFFMWIAADDLLGDNEYLKNLYKNFKNDIDYVFSNVSIINFKEDIVEHQIMHPFKDAKKKFDFAKRSIRAGAHVIYGLFRIEILREDFHLLEKFQSFTSYWEGYFCHVVCASRKGIFVPHTYRFWRTHEKNISKFTNPKKQLKDYMKYSFARLNFFYNYNFFSLTQRTEIILLSLSQDTSQVIILLKNYLLQKVISYQ